MPKEIWINLPVSDLEAAKEFYTQSGFLLHEGSHDNENMAGFVVEDHNVRIMLFQEKMFKGITRNEVAKTSLGTEVLFSLSAGTREEVDSLIFRIQQAGGTVFADPGEQNGMYGAGFCDLDGHRWNLLVMNE
ncbi:VOC family protein [Planococcus sp. CAU13]|uniref:VOC family protein n=1 Tax=Planococcus sp. CAU13 TaxID=1541197 RepID=UPI000530093D|nr:VOC family protein [Planococcus sp. CAU13]